MLAWNSRNLQSQLLSIKVPFSQFCLFYQCQSPFSRRCPLPWIHLFLFYLSTVLNSMSAQPFSCIDVFHQQSRLPMIFWNHHPILVGIVGYLSIFIPPISVEHSWYLVKILAKHYAFINLILASIARLSQNYSSVFLPYPIMAFAKSSFYHLFSTYLLTSSEKPLPILLFSLVQQQADSWISLLPF